MGNDRIVVKNTPGGPPPPKKKHICSDAEAGGRKSYAKARGTKDERNMDYSKNTKKTSNWTSNSKR